MNLIMRDKERDHADFKEELWNTVVKFGEPVLMATGLNERARKELLSKMVKLIETRQKTKDDECKDCEECDKEYGSTLVGGPRDDEGIGGLSEKT